MITTAARDLKFGVLLTFIFINIKIFIENVLNFLVFFNIVQSADPSSRYDIHSPSPPDIIGDIVAIIILCEVYYFITSENIKNIFSRKPADSPVRNLKHKEVINQIKNYVTGFKKLFFVITTVFSLGIFSKYFLSLGLETMIIENPSVSFVLSKLNDMIIVFCPLIAVGIYCRFLYASRAIAISLYLFYFIRSLLGTGFFGLVGVYDLHVSVPFLDILSPLIIIYSLVRVVNKSRRTLLSEAMELQRKADLL
ncbi:MAG: hypothetical protein MRJ65_05605 [Candidatus Brocadiaceae bacterium]|nr:hypothetical protein [Candidatus Brocadiaceae bacterium]